MNTENAEQSPTTKKEEEKKNGKKIGRTTYFNKTKRNSVKNLQI